MEIAAGGQILTEIKIQRGIIQSYLVTTDMKNTNKNDNNLCNQLVCSCYLEGWWFKPKELKKLWNMKVILIPFVIDALRTIPKGLVKMLEELEIGGWAEINQTTALLRLARIPRRVQETCSHLDSSEKASANVGVKNSQGVIIITMIYIGNDEWVTNLQESQNKINHFTYMDDIKMKKNWKL